MLTTIALSLMLAAPAPEPHITIDLHQADMHNVVRFLADVSKKNIVVSEEVKGKVTLKLTNVAWRTALDIVLKSSGYGYVEEDGIIWVTTQARIDADEERALDLASKRELNGPLHVRVIPVNNADAKAMAELVKPLLTARGSVAVDARTNVLIVRDVRTSAALR